MITAIIESFVSGRAFSAQSTSSTQSASSNNRQLRDTAKVENQVKKEPQKEKRYYCEYCGRESISIRYLTVGVCNKHPNGFAKGRCSPAL
jgi:hypothetical protein